MSKDSIEQIYKDYAKSVYKYLLTVTHDAALAEELTQETFYRAVYSIDRYDGSCKMSVWLCQIAKHVWFQELAKKAKYETQEFCENIPSPFALNDSMVLASEKTALYNAIHSLNEPMKEVVLLRLSGELSFAEIGVIMGKNENWARTTFYRAKQKLMEVL